MGLISRYLEFSGRLPAREEICLHAGTFTLIDGALDMEFNNPIMGTLRLALGAIAIVASINTVESRAALDNRGRI